MADRIEIPDSPGPEGTTISTEPWLYRVSPFPPNTEAGRHWATWVRATGKGTWVVLEHPHMSPESYRTTDGEWTFDRDDAIRHDLDTAMRLAREAIPGITVNGCTIHDAIERFAKVRD